MGGIISLMLRPLYSKLLLNKFGPKSSSLILTLSVVLLFILPLTLLTILAIKQGITIGHAISANENFSAHVLLTKINQWPPVNMLFDDSGVFEEKAQVWIEGSIQSLSSSVLKMFSEIPSILMQLVLVALSCFVFLIDGIRFSQWFAGKIPLETDIRKKLGDSLKDTAVSTIWATLAAGGAQSVVMLIAFLILGVPAPFLACGLTFIFAWIPLVGCSPIWGVASIYLVYQGMPGKAVLMVVFGLIAGIVDNIVRPMILKGRNKMHPLVGLISIFGGISLFGIVGVFIGPVLVSLMISLLAIWSEVGAKYGLLPEK